MAIKLDEKQEMIANLREGHYSIRAGGGAGKTAVLIERVNRLVKSGINPNDILLVTFTKAAAEEMRTRLDNPFVDCRTIHSFSLQILKDELWKCDRMLCPFDVITGTKRKILLQKCVDKVGVAEDLDLGTISLAIGKAKGMLAPSTGDREIDDVWKLYEQEKRKLKCIDFDDMSPMAISLLEKYPDIRKHFQRDWILVDEAHDTSVAQHRVIELIDKGNLFLISSVEQCFLENQIVRTPDGGKWLEELKIGDSVLSMEDGIVEDRVSTMHTKVETMNFLEVSTSSYSIYVTTDHKMFIANHLAANRKIGNFYVAEMRARELEIGMTLPVMRRKKIIWEPIIALRPLTLFAKTFDIGVENSQNLIVGGICSHNCIYAWRSAAPELIVNINKRYPDMQIIDLETNYRSGDTIINAANKLISSAKWKSLQMKGTGKKGDIRYVEHFNSLRDEADYIASSINNENSAILYRTNWYAMELELALRELDIEYHILGGLSFFDFSEIGDMIAYLRLADDPNDREAFLRVFNRPNRYLGNKWRNECEDRLSIGHTVESVLKSRFRSADKRELGYWWKNQEQLLAHLLCLRCFTSPGDIISYVRIQMKYDEWWRKERFSDEEDDDQDIYANLNEFELLARKYKTVGALLEQCKPGNDGKKNGVTLGTIHRAKGLEWNDVYGAGITSNLLPHFRNPDKEEERRLLYVLITRGIENVKLTSAFHKQFQHPSPLLDFLY